MTEPIRPAATEADKAIFDQLLQKISTVDSYFCCGGTLELIDRPLTLYYKSETGNRNWLDFGSMLEQSIADRQNAINSLLQACVPAPHGRGGETVLDESYRLARELRQNEFALSIDLLSEIGSGVLSSVAAMIVGRFVLSKSKHTTVPYLKMLPRLYKLNAYAKDGFFKSHRDTPKGNDHIGTLMIALPVAHQGGALRVSHDGKEVLFDWRKQCSSGVELVSSQGGDSKLKMSLPWAFLFSDVEHEVLPVVSGTRITIAYDIFASESDAPMGINLYGVDGPGVVGTTIPLCADLDAAMRNPSFLVNGGKVAIALSHSYPISRERNSITGEEFAVGLKGVDAIVHRAIKAAGIDVSLEAVMEVDDVEDNNYDPTGIPDDGYSPFFRTEYSVCLKCLLTSNIFKHKHTNYSQEHDYQYEDFVKDVFGARLDRRLMWIKRPTNTFTDAGTYTAYANEPSVGFVYFAAAFILDVSPYGQEPRVFS